MEKYLSPEEVCEIIPGMSKSLLGALRFRGDGPKFIKVSPKKVVYAQTSIEEYMKSRERTSTAAAS
ncbi:putative DNA-binding transcriptional regulator AlpA [Leifsonia sp. EB41]|uniref:helix-turn-helix transcriptional regulator n=1 Tax=Leifsonia sp. EB41 TaxID=3156260 RepID=UPI0035125D37